MACTADRTSSCRRLQGSLWSNVHRNRGHDVNFATVTTQRNCRPAATEGDQRLGRERSIGVQDAGVSAATIQTAVRFAAIQSVAVAIEAAGVAVALAAK